MREITTTDLCAMEVINLCDGGRLGYPSALECGFLGLGKTER